MFCSKCGKEISDDSKFCYSCGSKTIIEKTDSVLKESGIIEIKNEVGVSSITDKVENTKEQTINNQNTSNQGGEKKRKYGYGLLVLLLFYGSLISKWMKDNSDISIVTTIVIVLSFPLLIFLYFKSRNILLKRKYFIDKVWLSSFLSGFLSLMFIMSIIGFSTGIDRSSLNRMKIKEVNEFSESFIKQTKEYLKQESEYSKILGSEHKTVSEVNNKIVKIDEYKLFLIKKDKHFVNLINFLRETNSKYKKDKSVDEQINKLHNIISNNLNTSIYAMDMYKKYLLTNDEKFYNIHTSEFNKQNLVKNEVTKLITDIFKSL